MTALSVTAIKMNSLLRAEDCHTHTNTCACTNMHRVILFRSVIPGKMVQGWILSFTERNPFALLQKCKAPRETVPSSCRSRNFPSVIRQNSHCATTEEEGIRSATWWVECWSYLPKHSNSIQHARKGN